MIANDAKARKLVQTLRWPVVEFNKTKRDAIDEAWDRGFDSGYYQLDYQQSPAWRRVPHGRDGQPYHKGGGPWHAFNRGRHEGFTCRAIDELARERSRSAELRDQGVVAPDQAKAKDIE